MSSIENESASDGDLDEDYGESEGSSAAEQARRYGKVVKAVLALSVALAVGNADVRGRVRMHAAPDLGAGAGEPGSRLGSLQAKAWARRAVCWSMQLGRGPAAQILRRRREGTSTRPAPTATSSTRADQAFIDGTFHEEGAEVRTLDKRDLHVGLFGDWLERSGYGKYIERVQNEEKGMLWELRAVRAVRARNFSNHARAQIQCEPALYWAGARGARCGWRGESESK